MKRQPRRYGIAATVIAILATMALAFAWSRPPIQASELSIPTILPGRSFYQEWPEGSGPDLERFQDRLISRLGQPICADYPDGVYGNLFQKGPYVIEVGGNWSHPDRKWVRIERSWWPLW